MKLPLCWLCYHHDNQISVVIEPGASVVHARMHAALAGLDEGTFAERHELDRKTEKRVPKAMIGRLAVSERSEEVAGQVALTSGECSLARRNRSSEMEAER